MKSIFFFSSTLVKSFSGAIKKRLFMTLTWIAIIASLLMGAGAALIFIFAVKKDYFRDIEDAKYQVFWSDLEELVNEAEEENNNERKR